MVLVLLLQIEFLFFRQPEQLLSVEKRVLFFQFFISLLSALLIRVRVGNALVRLRFDDVRLHVLAHRMPKHRVLGVNECTDASSVPHHIVDMFSTTEAKYYPWETCIGGNWR